MDFFRKLFGFPQHPGEFDNPPRNEAPRLPFPDDNFEDFCLRSKNNSLYGENFNVFTDPLEMHRYFEQQMEGILRHFGMPSFGSFFHSFENPALQEGPEREDDFQHPRERFLKKGNEKPTYESAPSGEKVDKDLDGKLSITDLDKLFQGPKGTDAVPEENRSLNPYRAPDRRLGGSFFKQSVQVKTVVNPDGSYETHRTVTDSEGNQETTVTKKVDDKEYTVLKKRDREGKEEIHETLINMSEDEKALFTKPTASVEPLFDESLFTKFFK